MFGTVHKFLLLVFLEAGQERCYTPRGVVPDSAFTVSTLLYSKLVACFANALLARTPRRKRRRYL